MDASLNAAQLDRVAAIMYEHMKRSIESRDGFSERLDMNLALKKF